MRGAGAEVLGQGAHFRPGEFGGVFEHGPVDC